MSLRNLQEMMAERGVIVDHTTVHRLAAAIASHADCIVTTNLKYFRASVLAPFALEAIRPDQFLVAQLDLD